MEASSKVLKKRKKRLSVAQQAKKRARSKKHINEEDDHNAVDADLYTYLATLLRELESTEDEEQRASMVSSAMTEMSGKELGVSKDNLGSRLLERILPECNQTDLDNLRETITHSDELRAVANHNLASRVLEKLLDMHTKPTIKSLEWVKRMLWFMVNNLVEFSFNAAASHVLRVCLNAASIHKGASDEDEDAEDRALREEHLMPVLDLAVQKIVQDEENAKAMLDNPNATAVVITVFECVSKSGLSEQYQQLMEYFKSLLDDACFTEEKSLQCRALEAIIRTCDSKTRASLYEKLFEGRLIKLATHEKANFAVQHLINSCSDKDQFDQWYSDELDGGIGELLKGDVGALNVLLATASTCKKLDVKQNHFFAALQRALESSTGGKGEERPSSFLCDSLLVLKCSKESDVSLQGSLLIQTLLGFKKPIKVVRSLLDLESSKLAKILSTPRGSHIADAFVSSPNVGEKSRDGLAKKLLNEVGELVCSRNGSRAFDALWERSSDRSKELLASALSQKASVIRSNRFGQYIFHRLSIDVFMRNRDEWKQAIVKAQKKEKELEKFAQEFS